MSVIANGIKFGNISIDQNYTMTKLEMQNLGDAEGYPDIFPIWCSDEKQLYIYYKTTDGVPNIANYTDITATGEHTILFPTINQATNEISWEIKELTDEVPDPVTLVGLNGEDGADGKSAYDIWLENGNVGTEQDFLNSLKPDLTNLSDAQISAFKSALGIDTIESTLSNISDILDELLSDNPEQDPEQEPEPDPDDPQNPEDNAPTE